MFLGRKHGELKAGEFLQLLVMLTWNEMKAVGEIRKRL